MEGQAFDRRRRDEQRPGLPVRAEVIGRIDRDHAVPLPRLREVDPVEPGVCVIAAQKRRVEHPRQMHVVHELRAAGEEPGVFVARNRLTD